MSATTLLLISGAGLPAWVWDEAREGLDATVANRPWGTNASLQEYAQAALAETGTGPLTMVAHSSGGVVAAAVLALAPERIRGLLAITAVVPDPGRSFIGMMPVPQRYVLGPVMRVAGTRPTESAIRGSLAAGVTEEVRNRLVLDFDPESQAYYRNRVPRFSRPPRRGYLTTTQDREFSPALQRGFADRLEPDYSRQIESGHLPMLEHPGELRAGIAEFHASVRA
jgi:pimeloyl-ACP methyl ester carboxylesterase